VSKISQGPDLFLNIRVKPAANLNKLEEVLVVTKLEEKEIAPSQTGPLRAADILAQRLPSVPDKPAADTAKADKNAPKTPSALGAQTNTQTGVATSPKPGQVSASPKLAGGSTRATGTPAQVGAAPTASSEPAVKPSTKPANTYVGKPENGVSDALSNTPSANTPPATVKPTSAQKPLAPVMKVPDKSSKPAASAKPRPISGDNSSPDKPAPLQAKPDQPTPNQTQPVSPKPDQPGLDQPKPDQSKPDQPPPQNRPR
jgi:hypothetical protein